MAVGKLFFISVIIAIFSVMILPARVLSYTSADIPVNHWSYGAVEELAMAGLLGISGLDTRPMTRIQMAYKVKEAMDNIEEERLPAYLSLDRNYIEYLQKILYELINEFRRDLVLIGATAAQVESKEDISLLDKFLDYNLASPVEVEQRFAGVKSRKDLLLENENGLRLEQGYNLRARFSAWANARDMFTFSARPAWRLTASGSQLFFDEASAKISLANVELLFGKSAMWWGPGYHSSMLLSNNAEPLTLVKIRSINDFRFPGRFEKIGSFGVNFFVSKLEKDRTIPRPVFTGLRLEWSPVTYFSLAANRTSIMGGKGQPKPRIRDYFSIFTGAEELSSSEPRTHDTDQLASVSAKLAIPLRPELRIASAVEAYVEWAGEDRFYVIENECPGVLAGFFLTDVLRDKGTDFRFEYARDKRAWYDHFKYDAAGANTAYTYKGEIMGHHMGADADDLFFRISKELPFLSTPYFDYIRAGAQLDMERHGLSLDTPEKLTEFVLDMTWSHSDAVAISCRYEFEYYRNFNHVSGKNSRNNIFLVETDIKF